MIFKSKTNIEKIFYKINKRYYWIIAGLFTSFLFFIILCLAQMNAGGKYIFLRGDLFDTHVPYIRMMCRNILEGNSLWYSFENSMGINASLILAYYTCSPFNILYLIFYNANPNTITIIVLFLKLFFASAFFQLFSRYVLKNDSYFSILFSSMYSLCSFVTVYGFYHIMWLDSFLILPVLMLFIYFAFEKKKYWPLVIIYTYLFISQFYMGYIVGVFSLLVVLLYLCVLCNDSLNFKNRLFIFLRWLYSVFVSVLLSSFLLLPAFMFLKGNNPPDASAFVDFKYSITELINTFFWGEYVDMVGKRGFNYCGLPCLILVPSFYLNKEINNRKKIFASLVLLFLVLCYIVPFLYKLMHGFDQPDYFWFRFSFLLVFLFCSISCFQIKYINSIRLFSVIKIVSILVLIYSIEQRLQDNDFLLYTANTGKNLLINLAFILCWIIFSYLYVNCKMSKDSFLAVATMILSIELISNAFLCMDYKIEAKDYENWYQNMIQSAKQINKENDGFYRVCVVNDMIHNSDSLFGFNGIGDFGSAENYKVRKCLSNMGFGSSPRVTSASGFTPVSEMLLGVKYLIINPDKNFFLDGGGIEESYILPNPNALSVGYIVNDSIKDFSFESRNVFSNMNDLVKRMTGLEDDCFREIDKKYITENFIECKLYDKRVDGIYRKVLQKEDSFCSLGIAIDDNGYNKAYMQIEVENPNIGEQDFYYYGQKNLSTIDELRVSVSAASELYKTEGKDKFTIYISGQKDESPDYIVVDGINYYYFDEAAMIKHYEELSFEQLNTNIIKNGYIEGKISVSGDDKLLFTSIPFDEGWSVFVNGTEVPTMALLDGAFLGVELPGEGDYDIIMKYTVPGLKAGVYISLIGIISFFTLVYLENKKKKS